MTMMEDCSAVCNVVFARSKRMMELGQYQQARAELFQLEHKVRFAKDTTSAYRVVAAICQLHCDSKNWQGLAQYLSNVFTFIVDKQDVSMTAILYCMMFVDRIETNWDKTVVLSAMHSLSSGKKYMHDDHVWIAIKLSNVYADASNYVAAVHLLNQLDYVHGTPWNEKVLMGLEKMRLYIMLCNLVKAAEVANDINLLLMGKRRAKDLKIAYHKLMVDLKSCEQDYFACAEHYEIVLNLLSVKTSKPAVIEAAKATALYSLLARHSRKQEQLMERIFRHDALCLIPLYKNLMLLFISGELINWESMCLTHGRELRATEVFGNYPLSMKRWMDFRKSVVEYNIRVVASCQQNMSIAYIAKLLGITPLDTKYHLSLLMLGGAVNAAIDHVQEVVHFLPYARHRQNDHNHIAFDQRLSVIALAAQAFPIAQRNSAPRQNKPRTTYNLRR